LLQATHDPNQSRNVDTRPDDDTAAIRGHNLDAAVLQCAPLAYSLDLGRHDRRDKSSRGGLLAKPTLAPSLAPVQQKLPRYPMPTRRRRPKPRPRQALMHDPQLLRIRPAPAPACVYHLQTPNLMTVAIDVHNDSQHRQLSLPQGGPRRAVTERTFSLLVEHHDDGYLAYFPALPGCNTGLHPVSLTPA
jgi:hypothetical protein